MGTSTPSVIGTEKLAGYEIIKDALAENNFCRWICIFRLKRNGPLTHSRLGGCQLNISWDKKWPHGHRIQVVKNRKYLYKHKLCYNNDSDPNNLIPMLIHSLSRLCKVCMRDSSFVINRSGLHSEFLAVSILEDQLIFNVPAPFSFSSPTIHAAIKCVENSSKQ